MGPMDRVSSTNEDRCETLTLGSLPSGTPFMARVRDEGACSLPRTGGHGPIIALTRPGLYALAAEAILHSIPSSIPRSFFGTSTGWLSVIGNR